MSHVLSWSTVHVLYGPWVREELWTRKLPCELHDAERILHAALSETAFVTLGNEEIVAKVLHYIDQGRPPGGWPHEFPEH